MIRTVRSARLTVGPAWLPQPLFPGRDEADQLDKISSIMGTPNETNMPGFSKLEQ